MNAIERRLRSGESPVDRVVPLGPTSHADRLWAAHQAAPAHSPPDRQAAPAHSPPDRQAAPAHSPPDRQAAKQETSS
jgi:hypothetical protein